MRKVLHIVRKKSQLKASFIKNQISNHIVFKPYVAYLFENYKGNDGGFAKHDYYKGLTTLNLSGGIDLIDKLYYKLFRRISKKQFKRISSFITENNINVIHFHYGTDAGIFLKNLRKLDISKVVSFYGYECSGFPKQFFGLGKYYLKYRTFKYADKITAMSEDMKNDLLSIGCPQEKIIVHYHGAYTQRFEYKHIYKNKVNTNFLIISGLAPQKGHKFLLEAFKKAYDINPNIELTIVGEGETRELIDQTISDLDMQTYVSLNPFVVYGSEEHKKYFAGSDVFIHPSLTDTNGDKEGIPGAIVEAMAAGLPVISTYHAGIPFIIENQKTGILVKEWDIDSLSKAILEFASDTDKRKRIAIAGQKYSLENLDLYTKEIELEEIYKKLIL